MSGRVDRPYQERGIATLVGERWLAGGPGKPIASLSLADMAAELRNVGANAGCDALLVNPETSYGRSGVMLSATCIVYARATAAR